MSIFLLCELILPMSFEYLNDLILFESLDFNIYMKENKFSIYYIF